MNAMNFEEPQPSPMASRVIACQDCDAILTIPPDIPAVVHCPRCHRIVLRRAAGRLDRALAFYLTAAMCFAVANCFPILEIEAGGASIHASLFGAILALHAKHMDLIAILVGLTTVVIPTVELFCTTSVLILAESRHPYGTLAYFFRLRQTLKPWNMVEILMLGALVAIVKLGSLASVILGIGLWGLAAFMVAHAAASHAFDPKEFWNEIKRPP